MRCRSALVAVALGAGWVVPAAAQETNAGSQRVEVIGTSPAACVLDAPVAANAVNAAFVATGAGNGEVRISQFVDPQTANPLASSIELFLPVICNASHQFVVRSANGGLLRDGGLAANRQRSNGFADFVGYSVSLDWAGQSVTMPTDGGSVVLAASNARAGDVSLRIATPAGGGPLTAGRYDDTIIVEFRAAN